MSFSTLKFGKSATTSVRVIRPRRNIDKSLINVIVAAQGIAQSEISLITATFPCTITGLRWDVKMAQNAGTGTVTGRWAVIINRDGAVINSLTTSSGADLYEPEQDVLMFGVYNIQNKSNTASFVGSTKTMRKLQGGDQLIFLCKGLSDTQTVHVQGVIQFFCKT